MSEKLIQEIRGWLDKQGYPLEMQVARTLREIGFEVSSSEYYLDPDDQKPREIDVIATLQKTMGRTKFEIAYTVECKLSKNKPWVCFCSTASRRRDPHIGFAARYTTIQARDVMTELSRTHDDTTGELFRVPENHAYSVINAFKENGVDLPYQAILAAHKAAQAFITHYDRIQAVPQRVKVWTVCIAFPLVVVNAPIFNCRLDNNGEIELFQTEFQTVLKTGFGSSYTVVEIVSASALKTILESRAKLIAEFLNKLPDQIPDTRLKLELLALEAGQPF
jgi:hypothetical protein